MRLDKFLKATGLFKSRSAAHEACVSGRVLCDGKAARPARDVNPGQRIELRFLAKTAEYEVVAVPQQDVPRSQREEYVRLLREQVHEDS